MRRNCLTLNHRQCKQVVNLEEGYEIIQKELKKLMKKIKQTNNNKKEFVEIIQCEKFRCLKKKQRILDLVQKKYEKLNELTQNQFIIIYEEISIEQNEKYFQLNYQSNETQKDTENFVKT
ncbi:hypothetical protein M0812_28900 [Anaeramoeba flamelloides]|uniref:Uncharacterized protein n=1 Tax=Anaeramoeba flamelloides TaxID=1746091 RepID=A0AAV7YG42_9EUKA|nr:hypothetical protein M0812_28900 [Anaeramoeba flamelloides]